MGSTEVTPIIDNQVTAPAKPKPISQNKVEANRRNALRSTGPKTARGKRRVGRNAIKHGILAKQVVITGNETIEDFRSLLGSLWVKYEPVDIIEELLVQRMALCAWSLSRAQRFENKYFGDNVLRYDAQKERQFYRTIEELERLQARRKGASTASPGC